MTKKQNKTEKLGPEIDPKSGPQKWVTKTNPVLNLNSDSILGPTFGVHFWDPFWDQFFEKNDSSRAAPTNNTRPPASLPASQQPLRSRLASRASALNQAPKIGTQMAVEFGHAYVMKY